MEARNCPRCGHLFTKIRSPICPACEKQEEEAFDSLKNYINENPSCSLAELSENTNISIKRILQFIREGRLESSKGMHGEVRCEKCGKPIVRGRYCDSCAVVVGLVMQDALKNDNRNQLRMHTLNNESK